ncbi:DNA polymerase III subunit beta [Oxynema sp. CENA135]|uniref:DNA polymerase III subunit beta n=1 Tax=Oxynema sp. CENA135 TaxID=984206 RepID=UPI00190BC591|nr:DNA polymerase III subunit beta [Oxynema sp. CENA135]MBK4732001.1 DNA polymerase III subunit beta [Oxynema sp. CENA135]
MKFVCKQSDLGTNLSLVSRAVPSRPTHPVLANVLLSADEEKQEVSLTAFDLSLGIKTTFEAQVETEGTIALPAKLFNDIVSRLPEGEILFDDEAKDTAESSSENAAIATLTCATGRYQVRGMSADEFPALPTIQEGQSLEIAIDVLMEGLRGSLFATSGDETKQILTGVHVKVHPETFEFAATDGHRLAVTETASHSEGEGEEEAPKPSEPREFFEMTIPARALRELERMAAMGGKGEAIALSLDPGQIAFELSNQRLTSRTLEGQYPNYGQLIPRSFERQITVERRKLLSALERISILADKKNNIVKFSIDSEGQKLRLSVEAADVGSGEEALDAQISGESLDIAFNVKYAMESLKNLGSQEVQVKLNTATSPVVLTPLGGTKMTHLLMPVQLRS